MKRSRKFGIVALIVVGLAASAALIGANGKEIVLVRPSVAPWDFPDGPNPYPLGNLGTGLLGDPPGLVRFPGSIAKTSSGYQIELVSIGRRSTGDEQISPGGRPEWTPDGAPYLGEPYEHHDLGMARGSELEDRGGRYLTLKIVGQGSAEVSTHGYVPDGMRERTPKPEMHGWDVPAERVLDNGALTFRTVVAVMDPSAHRYRFALAAGEWKNVASAAVNGDELDDRVLASGPWGTLRQVAPPKLNPAQSYKALPIPQATLAIDAPFEPPMYAYRIRVLDAQGRNRRFAGMADTRLDRQAARVEVDVRPYEWVEFSNVHYNPDPGRWESAYWGEEGNRALSAVGATRLHGLLRPESGRFAWRPVALYAPDGRLWRGHPIPELMGPKMGGVSLPPNTWVASLQLDPARVSRDRRATITGYAADGPTPGKGLGEVLGQVRASQAAPQLAFPGPENRPYVQVSVRYARGNWRTVDTFIPPAVRLPVVPPERRSAVDPGTVTDEVFTLHLRPSGRVDVGFVDERNQHRMRENVASWPANDAEARVVARLKSGRRVVLPNNSALSDGSVGIGFRLNGSAKAIFDPSFADPRQPKIALTEVAAFEVQVREFGEPIYLVAKLPKGR